MRTTSEIIEEFNRLCQDVIHTLPELAHNHAKGRGLYLNVSDKPLEHISVWWDETNKADYMAQQQYINGLDEADRDMVYDSSFQQLFANPAHLEEFAACQNYVLQNGLDKFIYQRLIPHQVGLGPIDYGRTLRGTITFQEMAGMLKVLNIEPAIHLTTDPSVSNLRSAFRLCLDLTTTNGRSLIDNVARGEMMSIFPKRCRTIN